MDFGGFHRILRFNDKTGSIHALKHYTKRNIEAQSANNSRKRVILRYDYNFNPTDCTPERLKVREICAQAKLAQCSRDVV
jgi:hypothetical protein